MNPRERMAQAVVDIKSTARKFIRIETEPRERALNKHLGRMNDIEQRMGQVLMKIEKREFNGQDLHTLGELYGEHAHEMLTGVPRERKLVILGKEIQLPPIATQ